MNPNLLEALLIVSGPGGNVASELCREAHPDVTSAIHQSVVCLSVCEAATERLFKSILLDSLDCGRDLSDLRLVTEMIASLRLGTYDRLRLAIQSSPTIQYDWSSVFAEAGENAKKVASAALNIVVDIHSP